MTAPRQSTCFSSSVRDAPRSTRARSENAIATPTMNRKNGKTRSVGVHPFQSACSKGQ
jgi:hypothetical protein